MTIKYIVSRDISASQILQNNTKMTVKAQPGETYKLVDVITGQTPKDFKLVRKGGDLVAKNEADNIEVTFEGFWSNCSASNPCFLTVDAPQEKGGDYVGTATLTQSETEVSQLLAGQVGSLTEDHAIGYTSGLGFWGSVGLFAIAAGVTGYVIRVEEDQDRSSSGGVIILPPTPTFIDLEPPTQSSTGVPTVHGITNKPLTEVIVTFPDGSSFPVTTDSNGEFDVTATKPQPSGPITGTIIDTNTNKPVSDTVPFEDTTPPVVTLDPPTFTEDGLSVITGTTEPKTSVTITFPDGSLGEDTSDDNGNFSVTSTVPQDPVASKIVEVVATDAAGNTGSDSDTIRRLSPTDLTLLSEEQVVSQAILSKPAIDDITFFPWNDEWHPGEKMTFVVPEDGQPQTGETLVAFLRAAPATETEWAYYANSSDKEQVTITYNADKGEFTLENFKSLLTEGYYYISYELHNAAGQTVAQSSEYRFGIDKPSDPPIIDDPMKLPDYTNMQTDVITVDTDYLETYQQRLEDSPLLDRAVFFKLDENIDSQDSLVLVNGGDGGVWRIETKDVMQHDNNGNELRYVRLDYSASNIDVIVPLEVYNHNPIDGIII